MNSITMKPGFLNNRRKPSLTAISSAPAAEPAAEAESLVNPLRHDPITGDAEIPQNPEEHIDDDLKFHLEMRPYVDRVFLYHPNAIKEMKRVDVDEEKVVFNGNMPETKESVTAMVCIGNMGNMRIGVDKLFVKPLTCSTDSIKHPNMIIINFHKPTAGPIQEVDIPKECLIEFPKLFQDALDLPRFIRLDSIKKPPRPDPRDDKPKNQELEDYGFDIEADGWFVKKINHRLPPSEAILKSINYGYIDLTLYQEIRLKKIEWNESPLDNLDDLDDLDL